MKLPVAARDLLRKELRDHPDIERHVQSRDDIERMQKEELLSLTKQLQIDVRRIVKKAKRDRRGMGTIIEEDELARWRYPEENPAFSGVLEFDLKLTMLGKEFVRKARVIWDYTPAWEYFDLKQQRHITWGSSRCAIKQMEVLAVVDDEILETGPDGKLRKCEPVEWMEVDILDHGMMTSDIYWEIEGRIEKMCRQENATRRAQFKSSSRQASQKNSAKPEQS